MKTTKQLVKFDFDVAVISALDAKYKDIQITDGKSYALVMAGLAEYRELRLAIDDKHKELKRDILEAGRGLDGDKNRLKDLLEPGENHLKEIRQIEDDRKAKIKEEKASKERVRIEIIRDKIQSIQIQGTVHNLTSSQIEERQIILAGMRFPEDIYMKFKDQAIEAQRVSLLMLKDALTERLQFEKEAEERKAEAKRLEAQRKKQEAAQAKIDEENRKIEDEKHHLERVKEIEKIKKEREEFERQAKIKAEADAKENARQNAEEAEALAAVEAEKAARQEALRPDREKLIKFADELLDIECPDLKSTKAKSIFSDASNVLDELANNIKEDVNEL